MNARNLAMVLGVTMAVGGLAACFDDDPPPARTGGGAVVVTHQSPGVASPQPTVIQTTPQQPAPQAAPQPTIINNVVPQPGAAPAPATAPTSGTTVNVQPKTVNVP